MTSTQDIGTELSPEDIKNAIRFWRKNKQDRNKGGRPNKVEKYYKEIKHGLKNNKTEYVYDIKIPEAREKLSKTSNWRLNEKLREDPEINW